MSSWQIGDVRVDRVLEFERPLLPASVLFPSAPTEEIERHRHWLEPALMERTSGLMVIAVHSFLIRAGNDVILVDTCSGNDRQRLQKPRYHLNNWPYLQNLTASGIHPAEVTHVLCTHLHVDHVGWNTQLLEGKWVPTFPNARYVVSRAECEFWTKQFDSGAFTGDPYYIDCLEPIFAAGLSHLVDMDFEINDSVRLVPAPGHTPGHVCVHVRSGGQDAIMSGDLMHHPVQCAEPHWNSCFCVDQALARRTRMEFLDRYADTATLVMPAHFPTPSVGRIVPWGTGFHFTAYPR